MRNTNKLKAILKHYHLDLSLNEKEEMIINLFHKETGTAMTFEDPSYSKLISKAYAFMNKQLKEASKKG